jgi:hypothetical protein
MSVFGMGVTATDKLFLEFVLPGLNVEVIENTILYGRFETDTEHCVGKYAVFKALTASSKSARPSSSSTFPTAKQGTYDEYTLYMKRGMYAQLQFDGLALACSKGKGAVMDLLKAETKGIMIHIANKLNRQFWGDGSGRLATLNAASSASTSVSVDHSFFGKDSAEYTDPSTYLDEGMDCDIYSSAGVLEAEEVELSTIVDDADGTGTLTMAENVTASDNAEIFDHDTYAASRAAGTGVPMGLMGIVATTDPYVGITQVTFQGVDRDTNTWAQAYTEDMGSVAVTNAKMMKVCHKVEKYGRVDVILTNGIIWRSYYEILEADKTLPNEKAMWGGVTGLTFYGGRSGGIPVIWDDDCPDNRMFFLDTDYLQVYAPTQDGLTWLPGDSGILTRVQGADEFTASLVWYYNFGCERPKAEGVLYNVKHAAS